MKNMTRVTVILICFAFAKANTLQAQQQIKGIATYKALTKINMPKDSTLEKRAESDPMIRQIMEQLEKGSTQEYQLFFTPAESSYDKVQELAKPEAKKSGISISVSSDDGVGATIYKNIAQGTYTMEGNIMGKDFIIEDKLQTYAWQLQNETKKIGQYTCYKAIYKPVKENKEPEKDATDEDASGMNSVFASMPEGDDTITAWYTPDLPVSNGPGAFHGLPGLILEINTTDTTLLCTNIALNPGKGFELKKPKGGKSISQKDFDALQKKKMKELQERQGSKNGFIIQTIRN